MLTCLSQVDSYHMSCLNDIDLISVNINAKDIPTIVTEVKHKVDTFHTS